MFINTTPIKLLVTLAYVVTSAQALSDECKAENELIENSTAIANATAAFENATNIFIPHEMSVEILKEEWPDPLPENCTLSDVIGVNQTIVCAFDFAPYSADLIAACEAEGNQVYVHEYKFVCQSLSDRRAELSYFNYPACFGASCDEDNITEAVEGMLEDDESDAEEEAGFNCLLLHSVNTSGSVITPLLFSLGAVVVSAIVTLSL